MCFSQQGGDKNSGMWPLSHPGRMPQITQRIHPRQQFPPKSGASPSPRLDSREAPGSPQGSRRSRPFSAFSRLRTLTQTRGMLDSLGSLSLRVSHGGPAWGSEAPHSRWGKNAMSSLLFTRMGKKWLSGLFLPVLPEPSLTHGRPSKNICWMNEWSECMN